MRYLLPKCVGQSHRFVSCRTVEHFLTPTTLDYTPCTTFTRHVFVSKLVTSFKVNLRFYIIVSLYNRVQCFRSWFGVNIFLLRLTSFTFPFFHHARRYRTTFCFHTMRMCCGSLLKPDVAIKLRTRAISWPCVFCVMWNVTDSTDQHCYQILDDYGKIWVL